MFLFGCIICHSILQFLREYLCVVFVLFRGYILHSGNQIMNLLYFGLSFRERLSVAGGVTVFFGDTHVNLLSFMPICYRNLVFRSDNSRNMYIYEPEISILFSIFGKNVTASEVRRLRFKF